MASRHHTSHFQVINNGEIKVLDDCKDLRFDNTVPCEDTFLNDNNSNDEVGFGLDTQVMDVDLDVGGETQAVDFDVETQIMDDVVGETQPIDDYYDFGDTQPLDLSDNETSQETQPLDTTLGEKDISTPSDNVGLSSGSSERGFADFRTASLMAAGLAACQTASNTAVERSNELCHFDEIGLISKCKEFGVENDMTKCNEERSIDGVKSNVVNSLARKLFTEEGVTDLESDAESSEESENMLQFPSCDDNPAGLSYVDSQEPGDLSQANALEFVDKFLKVNMFESNQVEECKKPVGDIMIPGCVTKGAQSIAQRVSHRSTLAEASIYEWDVNLEDEGGGEFFTKKKEALLGHNSCPRPQKSKHRELRVSLSVGKLRDEKEQQVVHDTSIGFRRSDLKSVRGGEKGKVGKRVVERVDCSGQPLEALLSAQVVDTQNVGIDTQMAAEAIEALSNGSALVSNDYCVAKQSCQSEDDCMEKEASEDYHSKHGSRQERSWPFRSGVVTRSRSKGIIMKSGQESKCRSRSNTYRRSVIRKLDVSPVKPNEKRKRSSMTDNLLVSRRKSSDDKPVSADNKCKESILELQVNTNVPRLSKRRSLRGKSHILTPTVQEAVQCVETPTDTSGDCRGVVVCLEASHETRKRQRKGMVLETFNTRKGTVDQFTSADHDKVDGLYCKRGDDHHASGHVHQSENIGYKLNACRGTELTTEYIARRTRSKRNSVQGSKHSQDRKCLLTSGLLSSEDNIQSSSKKQDAVTPPGKGSLTYTIADVTPENMQKLSHRPDVTPVHVKTTASAVSPICIGDGYQTPSCKRRVSLQKECISLISSENKCSSPFKCLRLRKDMNKVRVLFSQHLDDDIIKQQKKILSRLGVLEASTILEATHFVADSFVRTRNMLEAIANGKPVVTHFWLENCGQAKCLIDEKNYILRDAKKEKELGFSMPKSLAHASLYPLLEGKTVLMTPNVKPGKEVISSLVKSVCGQAVERLGRSMLIELSDDLLVLSCEEDYEVSRPLLEKGIAVYSSELLLNGIITQRLEYERYRLFVSSVKITRSTLWLKKGEDQVRGVSKIK